ncbi:MAG: hypothetical protein ACTSU5_16185 [Promethearchaeota archaeon]
MLTYILGVALAIWLFYKRKVKGVKVEGPPLGLPAGTIRAYLSILIIAFPFNYLTITNSDIPGTIATAIFVVVAFYFGRRMKSKSVEEIVREIKHPDDLTLKKKADELPMYFPKYTVRLILVSLIVSFAVVNSLTLSRDLVQTNTSFDLLVTIAFFVLGTIARGVVQANLKKKVEQKVLSSTAPEEELVKALEKDQEGADSKSDKFMSVLALFTTIFSLVLFTGGWDLTLALFGGTLNISLREISLLVLNAYFGYRS